VERMYSVRKLKFELIRPGPVDFGTLAYERFRAEGQQASDHGRRREKKQEGKKKERKPEEKEKEKRKRRKGKKTKTFDISVVVRGSCESDHPPNYAQQQQAKAWESE